MPTRDSVGSLFSNRGGDGSIAANVTVVRVLQGNLIYALDARSLRIRPVRSCPWARRPEQERGWGAR